MLVSRLVQIRLNNSSSISMIATFLLIASYLSSSIGDTHNEIFEFEGSAKEPLEDLVLTSNISETKNLTIKMFYIHGHDRSYPYLCPDLGGTTKLIIIVTSAPENKKSRGAIRRTWGQLANSEYIPVVFILGVTENQTIIESIEEEQRIYQDIVRGNFLDTYDNLTLKTISLLELVDNYCPRTPFVLKVDDDTFINVCRLLDFITNCDTERRAIYGRVARNYKPVRDQNSKYYVSNQQYNEEVFPNFTTGPAYLFPTRLSQEIYSAALNHPYFKLEDVFFTGIVANHLNISRVHIPGFLNDRISFTPYNIRQIISMHKIEIEEQYVLWEIFEMANYQNCIKH